LFLIFVLAESRRHGKGNDKKRKSRLEGRRGKFGGRFKWLLVKFNLCRRKTSKGKEKGEQYRGGGGVQVDGQKSKEEECKVVRRPDKTKDCKEKTSDMKWER